MAYSGEVKSYSVFKGFGFIFPGQEGEPDIFLHVRSMVDGTTPKAGDTLTFDLEEAAADEKTGAPGQMKATNVRGGTGFPLTEAQKAGKGKEGGGKGGADAGPYGKGYGQPAAGGAAYGAYTSKGGTQRLADLNKGAKGAGSKGGGGDGKGAPDSKVDPNAPPGEYSGRVKSYSIFKGLGFILNEGEPDIFLHVRNMVDGTIPKEGDTLTFNLEPADGSRQDGQMKALHVRGGTGYPLTAEQKGGKNPGAKGDSGDKGKGKAACGKDPYAGAWPADPYGKGAWGADPYGKGCKGWEGGKGWDAWGADPYGKGWGGCKGWEGGCKGWDGAKGWAPPPWEGGKPGPWGKGW